MAADEETGNDLRFRNGLPADASEDEKVAFAIYCLKNYQRQEWSGDSLSEFFAEDFASFSVQDFKAIDSDTRQNLRDLLRKRRVYVPKVRNTPIANSLYQVAQEVLQCPSDDPEKPVDKSSQSANDAVVCQQGKVEPLDQENVSNHKTETGKSTAANTSFENGANRRWKQNNMANLFKAYGNDSDKYTGSTMDNFDQKFMLFLERCEQAEILEEDRHRAFSIMLTGHAPQSYFDFLKEKKFGLDELETAVKPRFVTPERTRALLREWESLTLTEVTASNGEKSPSSCLELLIEKLSDIQTSLPPEYRNEMVLRKKLLNAVKDASSCQLAYYKPDDTVQGVIEDLYASLATLRKEISAFKDKC